MHARLWFAIAAMLALGGCAWHYPMPVYPPYPPDYGYSAPYDPLQPYAPPPTDASMLQPSAPPMAPGA